jgi:hypothetical protein
MSVVKDANMSSGTAYGVGNISSAYAYYRPSFLLSAPCLVDNGSSTIGLGIVTIQTDGVVNVTPITSGTSWRRAMISVYWDV